MRAAPVLLVSVVAFAALEGAVFHTGLYPWILNPDASTGDLETTLRDERDRPKNGPQILGIGDSRMLLESRLANQHTPESGYTFGNIATAGASPRAWFYMLRDTDPAARQYHAIVIAVESYDDLDTGDDESNNAADLSYLAGRLRLSDLWEYSRSYQDTAQQWKAARGILLKGLVYKRDFEDLLLHPGNRILMAKFAHRDSFKWHYNYTGPPESLAAFHIDWNTQTLTAPPNADPEVVRRLKFRLLYPLPPQNGGQNRYMKYWLGKIYEHYRDSPTRLIFLRLPRGGFVRPDPLPSNSHSSVRELAARSNVTLIDEHFFDSLETPELFRDEMHLNGPGMDRFSLMLTQEVSRILGHPR
ncbi:MAG TPA: hypothetical protein VGQ49_07810 [Bryobacteraceae bacterium]|jgi:hypothetical protein|nr:hypothetical protein [Bryobacteraceae bacterium]